ncbi:polyphosphate kinase 1 [Paenalcaligenes sp. Me131]|uniref:polyphosphate kinase 1 n=1 Tax=Paenalcaligenes sp. Me131 TaxID=3392636 RepID=UPI003D2C50FC
MLPSSDAIFLNRELSLLKFNERVMAMAENAEVPLLERLRYLCIVSSNLDEFFEIRVSSLKEQILQKNDHVGEDGFTPQQAFDRVQQAAHALVDKQNKLLVHHVLPQLMEEGIGLLMPNTWTDEIRAWAYETFSREIMPLLTPIGLDPAHPFPRVYNKSLNFIIQLSGSDAFGRTGSIAIVQAPRALPRLIAVPPEIAGIPHGYMLLTSLIKAFVGELFPGMQLDGVYQWRVTRNSDLFVDEEEVTNLRQTLQGELSQRNFGAAVRLEIDLSAPANHTDFLQREFNLTEADTYRVLGPVNLSRLSRLCDNDDRPDLLFPPYRAPVPAPFDLLDDDPSDFFNVLSKSDQLLHHPYQSFSPILSFLRAAALDPHVVAIKQTIYRTGEDSELMSVLLMAARAGKEVTVVVELMARFDEQTNINWAARLEEVGAHVSYGVVGHKTHAKMALVLRREKGLIRRYGHLGTGNYHPRTAKLYEDFGLLTADTAICEDMDKIFAQLTGLGARRNLTCLLQAPFTLHEAMIAHIHQERDNALAGKKAKIMAKMNSLLEPRIIKALYEASQAGVSISLVIRGICALRAGVPGLSENIQVRSIVGRFLEHSRVFYFYNSGEENVYLSSADWMERNFFRRVELGVPVLNKRLKRRVISESFTYSLKDNQLAWKALPDGRYVRVKGRGKVVNVHQLLMDKLGPGNNKS